MKLDRLNEILNKIKNVKIAVYGDFGLDAYWILNPAGGELSVETGLQSQAVEKHYYTLGAASNVAANLAALQPKQIKTIGVLGNDIFGRELKRQLETLGIDVSSMVIQEDDFYTYTFAKRVLQGEEQPRIDFGFLNKRSHETDEKILNGLKNALESFDAVIFNQQVPGSLTNHEFITGANQLFDEYNDKIVLLDSRHYGYQFSNIFRKANEIEAACLNGVDAKVLEKISFDDVQTYAENLFQKSGKPLFITMGADGILTVSDDRAEFVPGIKLEGTLDTVGAGDTVISALAACLGAGIKPTEAAAFANLAAGVTVQKLYMTGTASGEEIVQLCKKLS